MLSDLGHHIKVRLKTLDRLDSMVLEGVDLALLCTTQGLALDQCEQTELERYVKQGGTAIVSRAIILELE